MLSNCCCCGNNSHNVEALGYRDADDLDKVDTVGGILGCSSEVLLDVIAGQMMVGNGMEVAVLESKDELCRGIFEVTLFFLVS